MGMIGGAIESSDRTQRTALVRTGRRGGHAACEEHGEGGEDADAEVGLVWGEERAAALQLEEVFRPRMTDLPTETL